MQIDSKTREAAFPDWVRDHSGRVNPGLIKLDLYCKGLRIGRRCDLETDARLMLRTRAGLGSGLELVLPDDLHINVPVLEPFAEKSPYLLDKQEGQYVVTWKDETVCPVQVPSQPVWYTQRTSSGLQMAQIGILQGTSLGIYFGDVCDYWKGTQSLNCKFCATGLNVGVSEAPQKRVADVVETCRAAQEKSGTTFVHFNSGYHGQRALTEVMPYVEAVKRETGMLVGVQCTPEQNRSKYDRLIDIGTDHFSFCLELYNRKVFGKLCPGKERTLGLDAFFEGIEYTSRQMGKGKVSGEMIAGLEPVADTCAGIDHITRLGAFPTVCVFRPLIGTGLAHLPPPPFEDLVPVFRHMYEACKRERIPTGIAPNVKVSLVVLPYEGKYFVGKQNRGDVAYAVRLAAMRAVYRSYFWTRMWLDRKVRN